MQRLLLASCLLIWAAGATASEPVVATESASQSCTKAAADAAEKNDARSADEPATGAGGTAPVRPRSSATGRATPRWNSLLPGMIR
ncbi:hypothetical protein [Arenimonas sp.]|uniref:hypothetical protein n=1 Tax=Arenimonas sp. TaxID=1872635 RepID=UPI0025EB9DF4|nr:hypothetical protein [Arenimonas sp.]